MRDPDPPCALVHGLDVYDEATRRYGVIVDTTGRNTVWVRPRGGGREWTARREHIRPALASELLALRLPKAPQ